MSSNTAIKLENVNKEFKLFKKPADRLIEIMPFQKPRHKKFHALKNINLEIKRGEVVGIVGRNGAGKSTLLQIICKTLPLTTGKLSINGRIAALLELGAGFNPEFTGRENVWMNASILGMTKNEIAKYFDEIVAFSEIGTAIDQPVKTYSSGMFIRLAFSVAVHVSPEILVIDEALSVGDGAFAKKSFDRIMQLKAQGCTILFCSHSLYQIEAICNRAIWIEAGECKLISDAKTVSVKYQSYLASITQKDHDKQELKGVVNAADTPVKIKNAKLKGHTNQTDEGLPIFTSEQDDWNLELEVQAEQQQKAPTFGIIIYTSAGFEVTSFSSQDAGLQLSGQQKLTLSIPRLPLLKGSYYVDIFILCDQGIHVYEHLRYLTPFEVTQTHLEIGVVRLDRQWMLEAEEN